MIVFMRNMLGAALKTNNYLKFAILTGCLRIAKESMFTGLNNFSCYSISESEYADKFGFTETEVDSLLELAGFTDKKQDFKEWYNGYNFGNVENIYCPWDILTHLNRLQRDSNAKPQTYWNNTSDNAIVKILIENESIEINKKIETLISGKAIKTKLNEDLTYDIIYKNENNVWTLLYLTGYLTKVSTQKVDEYTLLYIPNKEVRTIFLDVVASWFAEKITKHDWQPLREALWQGDAERVQTLLTRLLYETISYYDSAESFYHGFLVGLLRGAGFELTTNEEYGLGRPDICIEDLEHGRAMIIEVKLASQATELARAAQAGIRQIVEKKYAKGLPSCITAVIALGIAFWKKEVCVSVLNNV